MTQEFRRLTFSFDEVPEILKICGNEHAGKFPGGSVCEVECKAGQSGFHYSVKFFDASNGKENCIDITEEDTQQALIDFCRMRKIPMPRDAIKTVRVVNCYLCMDILIGEAARLSTAEEIRAS